MARITRLEGVRALDAALQELAGPAQKRVTRTAVQATGRIAMREVRNAAPVGKGPADPKYGRLKRNIRVRTIPGQNKITATIHTGRAFWAKWIEYGRSAFSVRRKRVLSDGSQVWGREVSAMPARPFFRPAWDRVSGRLLPELTRRIAEGISREVTRLPRPRRGRR